MSDSLEVPSCGTEKWLAVWTPLTLPDQVTMATLPSRRVSTLLSVLVLGPLICAVTQCQKHGVRRLTGAHQHPGRRKKLLELG